MNSDKLNIFLIVLSGVLAVLFPLELFVLAYVILGPLHYLTEINWLDGKKYYFNTQRYTWLLIGGTATLIIVLPKLILEYSDPESSFYGVMSFVSGWSNSAIFAALCIALAAQFIKSKLAWTITALFIALGAFFLNSTEHYGIIVGMFIPTIIHVYLFTLLFMLYGAKKNKSTSGYFAVLLAVLMPLVFVLIRTEQLNFLFPDSFKSVYIENGFHIVPVLFSKYLGISEGTGFFFYESMELRLLMFMSFIYLYHYLNWFSKTTVIQWHKNLTTKRTITIVVLWLGMLLLFYFNFRLGFLVSLFFSFLHVILEFPLNVRSIKGLFQKEN